MSVVGIDIGDHSTYIAITKSGGVETIANDYSQRNTPSIVAFGEKQRFVGVSAENQRNLNVKNTISNFKNFHGKKISDPYIQENLNCIGASVKELENEKVGFKVGDKEFSSEQVLAMLFTKVKDLLSTNECESNISSCVVSIPQYFNSVARNSIRIAAEIANMKDIHLMSDTSALALAYAKAKDDLPEESDPRYVVFVDFGSAGLQTALVSLSRDKVKILNTSSCTNVGGRFFDAVLSNHFLAEIHSKYNCKIGDNLKALNKVRRAVEKVKKQMSANSSKLPFQIESLIEDVDIDLTIDRETFEELIKNQLEKVRNTFTSLLDSATVNKDQLHSVEVVGGSSRIPAVKRIMEEVFGISPSFSLNADEAVARGCCLHSAALSGKFLTKRFDIEEEESMEVNESLEENTPFLDQMSIDHLKSLERQMIDKDKDEICRQEAKNDLEEQLYQFRATVCEIPVGESDEETANYISQTEDWLYEEGEDAPKEKYEEMLNDLHTRISALQLKRRKMSEMLKKEKEREDKEQQQRKQQENLSNTRSHHPQEHTRRSPFGRRQVNHCEDEELYSDQYNPWFRSSQRKPSSYYPGYNYRQQYRDPFNGFGRSSLFQSPMFGW